MYLTELCNFYDRMVTSGNSHMPPAGMSTETIGCKLVLSKQGDLREILSLCDSKGKGARMMVPAAVKRSSGIRPNFLWDNTEYVLGVTAKNTKNPDKTSKCRAAFVERVQQAAQRSGNADVQAVATFLHQWQPERFADLPERDILLDQNVVFAIEGEQGCVHQQPDVLRLWESMLSSSDAPQGRCLVTGELAPIALVHPAVKGVPGAQTSGAALVSFNCPAFTSFNKEQNANAPVSERAARAYTAALNYLLRRENGQCVRVGDTSVVFWAERPSPAEDALSVLLQLGTSPADGSVDTQGSGQRDEEGQDTAQVAKVRSLLQALRQGKDVEPFLRELDKDVRFFVLGLAPNAARLSVRFWQVDTFGEVARRVAQHYTDSGMERRRPDDKEFPTLQQFLLCIAPQGKQENIPPLLGGQLAMAVFTGRPYPESLYRAVLQRVRAEKDISYLRTSLIAAYLRRNHHRSITMSLNEERTDAPYVLGRLFAVLEKAQLDALGNNINSTIKDRYFNAASSTPAQVFPVLLRLAQHHLDKLKKAEFRSRLERIIGNLVALLDVFPKRLSLDAQGDFIIGYYQQRNALYTKKETTATSTEE